jgi:hypothetical protein
MVSVNIFKLSKNKNSPQTKQFKSTATTRNMMMDLDMMSSSEVLTELTRRFHDNFISIPTSRLLAQPNYFHPGLWFFETELAKHGIEFDASESAQFDRLAEVVSYTKMSLESKRRERELFVKNGHIRQQQQRALLDKYNNEYIQQQQAILDTYNNELIRRQQILRRDEPVRHTAKKPKRAKLTRV